MQATILSSTVKCQGMVNMKQLGDASVSVQTTTLTYLRWKFLLVFSSGKDLIGVQNLLKKHQALQAEITGHEPRIKAVTQKGEAMVEEGIQFNSKPCLVSSLRFLSVKYCPNIQNVHHSCVTRALCWGGCESQAGWAPWTLGHPEG